MKGQVFAFNSTEFVQHVFCCEDFYQSHAAAPELTLPSLEQKNVETILHGGK